MKIETIITCDADNGRNIKDMMVENGISSFTQRKILSFNELSEKSRQNAIDQYRDNPNNFVEDFWSDYDGKLGFSDKEIKEFSPALKKAYKKMFRSAVNGLDMFAGDNKCFYDVGRGEYIQFPDLSVDDECFRVWLGIPKKLWKKVIFSFYEPSYISSSTSLEFEYCNDLRFYSKNERSILEDAIAKFKGKVRMAWEDLKESYEYQFTNECIIENFESNDYEFTEDGKLWTPQK